MNKKTKRLFRLALAISVLSFSFCGASIAELENKDLPDRTGFKYDPLIVHAAFKTELQFDTNVFLESEDENFDVLTLLNPSVGFELPLGDNHFSADYSFGSWIFGTYNNHSYFDHTVRALAEINWTDYKITLSDFYRYFSDRAGTE
ncbi:MAG: hypothetical protein HQ579_06295, partial [Candidatus Omnitrophica bacterium]|nr:hypothetical protein [Candidatus Omnitrophota bacterium]